MKRTWKLDGVIAAVCVSILWTGKTWIQSEEVTRKETLEPVQEACNYLGQSTEAEEVPKIALTFDDGPSKEWTALLLDGLRERNVKATFFLIGENAKACPDLVRRMAEEGHLIGNHTYHHVELTQISEDEARVELNSTSDLIEEITGERPEYMRPPFGSWQRSLEAEIPMLPVLWSIDPLDWTTENTDEIVNQVVTEAEENDIILLHDCYKSSVEAGLRIVDILQKEGFQFVTADELLLK